MPEITINRWGVVGFNWNVAAALIKTIECASLKTIVRKIVSKNQICTYFDDGTILRWVPARENSRGLRLDKIFCDANIDREIFNQIILPMFKGKKEDIIWLDLGREENV